MNNPSNCLRLCGRHSDAALCAQNVAMAWCARMNLARRQRRIRTTASGGEQSIQLVDVMDLFDANRSGDIDKHEFVQAIRTMRTFE